MPPYTKKSGVKKYSNQLKVLEGGFPFPLISRSRKKYHLFDNRTSWPAALGVEKLMSIAENACKTIILYEGNL